MYFHEVCVASQQHSGCALDKADWPDFLRDVREVKVERKGWRQIPS
jgi:hypothetical protein